MNPKGVILMLLLCAMICDILPPGPLCYMCDMVCGPAVWCRERLGSGPELAQDRNQSHIVRCRQLS